MISSDMKAFHYDRYTLELPPGYTFPIAKYALLRQRIEASGLIAPDDLLEPGPATDAQILRVHEFEYFQRVVTGTLSAAEVREIGLPWSPALVERTRRSAGATLAAAFAALDDQGPGIAVNLAGGTHHAFAHKGAGYCVFNDAAIAIRELQSQGRIARAIIIDCDVHQGDGTASIFLSDPSVFTFSIHGAKNYPLRKQSSDLDIELPDKTGDDAYLTALDLGLDQALERAQAPGPGLDLAIYLAGADPYEGDRLGRMSLTREGLAERDRRVFERLRNQNLPIAVAMAGGYGKVIAETVEIQYRTVEEAKRAGRRPNSKLA